MNHEEATQLNPAATVAICTLDRREVLGDRAGGAGRDRVEWEILVVDNGSTDGTAQRAEARILTSKILMRLLVSRSEGFRSRGIARSRTPEARSCSSSTTTSLVVFLAEGAPQRLR